MLVILKLWFKNSWLISLEFQLILHPGFLWSGWNKWTCGYKIWDAVQKTMQASFRKKVAMIIDCYEIFIPKLSARASTWSYYKHHNKVKGLYLRMSYHIRMLGRASEWQASHWTQWRFEETLTWWYSFISSCDVGTVVFSGSWMQWIRQKISSHMNILAFTKGKQ